MIARGLLDGLWIGAVAGAVYAALVALAGLIGGAPDAESVLGLAALHASRLRRRLPDAESAPLKAM